MYTDNDPVAQAAYAASMNFYKKTLEVYARTGYDKAYKLSIIWATDPMTELHRIINECRGPLEAIAAVHRTFMYAINTADENIKTRMIDFYLDELRRSNVEFNSLDPFLQESPVSNPDNSQLRDDRLVSPDFLQKVNLCFQVFKHCDFSSGKGNILELGGGYGGFARVMKILRPGVSHVIIDIPETLFFSSLFLRLNFPAAKLCYVTDDTDLKGPVSDYDFIFIPTKFAGLILRNRFELFYNTLSLGEMTNEHVLHWMNFVQQRMDVRYFFGLNRYLNTTDPDLHQFRQSENRSSVSFDTRWKVLEWELDPSYTRCPYVEPGGSRPLLCYLERLPAGMVNPSYNRIISERLARRAAEADWYIHADEDNVMRSRDNFFSPDLTMNGPLFKLWEAIRLCPTEENVSMMLTYLSTLERGKPFEETYYYRDLLAALKAGTPLTVNDVNTDHRVGLKDQKPLSDQEIAGTRHVCAQIQALVAQRSEIVQTRGLDPKFALPDANWKESPDNVLYQAYRYVLEGDYQTLNTLRFFAPFFTGYRIRSFEPFQGIGCIEPILDDFDALLPELLPAQESDIWVGRWREMTRFLPDAMVARPQKRLGEIGWNIGGVIVNHDTAVYQERLNLLVEAGIIDLLRRRAKDGESVRILEIGGGYGALAGFLKGIVPEATYTICDLPESLLFSALYLGLTQPEAPHLIYHGANETDLQADTQGFRYLPNYLFCDLLAADQTFDLVINTLSMSEMTEVQVRGYAAGIRQLIGDTGVFFEQNQDNRHMGLNYCKEYLAEHFVHRTTLSSITLPGMTEGIAETWSNRPLVDILRTAPEIDGDFQNYREAIALAWLHKTAQELDARQITADDAVDRMITAVNVHPGIASVVAPVGISLCRSRLPLPGLRLFEGITLAVPTEAAFHNLHGEALFQLGQFDAAQAAFLRASELAPERATIHSNLAVTYWRLGEAAKALACVELATQLDPENDEASTNLAAIRSAIAEAA